MAFELVLLFSAGITYATAVLFPALGEVFSEYSGVYNIGLEGIMLISTSASFIGTAYTGNPFYGVLVGILSGGMIGVLQAFFAVKIKADQVIFGIGIILLGPFLSSILVGGVFEQTKQLRVPTLPTFGAEALPSPLNVIFKQNILVYVSFLLTIAFWYLITKTHFGLALRATGEDPNVAAAAGIDVVKMRYVSSIVGCAVAALGGSFLLLGVSGEWTFNMTAGLGFLAIALVRLGLFRPVLIFVLCLIFGFVDSLQLALQVVSATLPHQVLQMVPYLLGIVALIISGRFKVFAEPASLGKPYEREHR